MNFGSISPADLSAYWSRYFASVHETDWTIETAQPMLAHHLGLALQLGAQRIFRGSVLDVGSGHGVLSAMCAAAGAKVMGIDVVAEHGDKFVDDIHGVFVQVDLSEVPWDVLTRKFDVVFLIEVLQCLDLKQTLREAWRHLQHGGRMVFTVPWAMNPINVEANLRHNGMFQITDEHGLKTAIRECCPDAKGWKAHALHIDTDQRFGAYDLHDLDQFDPFEAAPYRVMTVVAK